jgi:regulatory protein
MKKYQDRENKSATLKAMELLLYKSRTEKELTDKLLEKGYSEDEIKEAVRYVKSYGYLNDEAYVEQYVSLKAKEKGRSLLKMELKQKGVDESLIDEALMEIEDDEEQIIYDLIKKRAGEPRDLDEKEYRRLFAYCARRGFSGSKIHKALKQYKTEAE